MILRRCTPPRHVIRAVLMLAFGLLTFKLCYQSINDFVNQQNERQAFLDLIPDDLFSKPVTDERSCKCTTNKTLTDWTINAVSLDTSNDRQEMFSSCDNYSSSRGPHQSVVSYAFYGPSASNILKGIELNAERVAKLYDGWTMRVYHSIDTGKRYELEMLCKLWCRYPHLDLCQVGRLPQPLGDLSHLNGMVWRFLVLGDRFVDRFVVRDLDSIPFQREADAVHEWIRSNVSWHLMNDNPSHATVVMGGMWGGMNRDLQQATEIRRNLMKDGDKYFYKGYDQELLAKHLWPSVERSKDYIRHASYVCNIYPGSIPFPSRRRDREFVGSPVILYDNQTVNEECPVECRPKEHLDWVYC